MYSQPHLIYNRKLSPWDNMYKRSFACYGQFSQNVLDIKRNIRLELGRALLHFHRIIPERQHLLKYHETAKLIMVT